MQPGRRNGDAAVNALAVAARLNAVERGVHRIQLRGLVGIQCKFQLAFSRRLGARVLGATEMVCRGLGTAHCAAPQLSQLLQQAGAPYKQLGLERIGEGVCHGQCLRKVMHHHARPRRPCV